MVPVLDSLGCHAQGSTLQLKVLSLSLAAK